MKKLLLSTATLLGIAASIFGGYYFYVTNDLQEPQVGHNQIREEDTLDATDKDVPLKQRGGALMEADGHINPNGLQNALAQRDLYLTQHMPSDGFGDKGEAIEVPNNWQPRGPQNMGGRTEAILLHPAFGCPNCDRYSNTMWAGGASGGIWFSTSAGNNWKPINGELGNFNVSCLVMDPLNPKTLYAGTGARDLNGGGVFKSTDGGMNWIVKDQTRDREWKWVNSLSVARKPEPQGTGTPRTILLAAVEHDYGYDENYDHGIMRSDNDGLTWTNVINADTGQPLYSKTATFVGFDPANPAKAMAATCGNFAPPGAPDDKCHAWYSTDYGASWRPSQLERPVCQPMPRAIPWTRTPSIPWDDEPDKDDCDKQLARDEAVCNRITNPGMRAARRHQAFDRWASCRTGRNIPHNPWPDYPWD